MTSKREVENFLNQLKVKMKICKIVFRDDRTKNAQALHDLNITPAYRKEIIEKLHVNDYSEGPIEDTLYYNMPLWVFGKEVKNNEVYIKITLGQPNLDIICISFHIAKQPMNYPFK